MNRQSQLKEKRANGTTRVATVNTEETKTQQHHKDACDINNIMKKYRLTGEITHLAKKQMIYGDRTQIKDYQTSLDTVIQANESFMALPSDIRKRFSNDPKELIEFLSNTKNDDEAIQLGLKIQNPNKQIKQTQTNQTNQTQTPTPTEKT